MHHLSMHTAGKSCACACAGHATCIAGMCSGYCRLQRGPRRGCSLRGLCRQLGVCHFLCGGDFCRAFSRWGHLCLHLQLGQLRWCIPLLRYLWMPPSHMRSCTFPGKRAVQTMQRKPNTEANLHEHRLHPATRPQSQPERDIASKWRQDKQMDTGMYP